MKNLLLLSFCCLAMGSVAAVPASTCDVYPDKSVIVEETTRFQREKFINIGCNVSEFNKNVKENDADRFDTYMNDYKMTVGRGLGMVSGQAKWTKSLREDPARPGYADLDYIKSKNNPNDNGLDPFKEVWGSRQGLAIHDSHNAYSTLSDWMNLYSLDGNETYFPSNTKASGEIVANILKYAYTDFQRPSWYELVNEPDYHYLNDSRFWSFHTDAKKAVDLLGLDVKIGGPCSSVSYYYRNKYQSANNFFDFINNTNGELDFYSFHSYDYMKWDEDKKNFVGSVTSGLPLQGVLDACASYGRNKYGYGKFHYLASEHGGYVSDEANKEEFENYLSEKYFPRSSFDGTDFEYEMKVRSIENFIMVNSAIANTMTYMNNSNIVLKTVPFIMLETSSWDPKYYSTLLIKENFDKTSTKLYESRLIDFYKFFAGVEGRNIHSFCADTDIQHLAFVNGKKLILLFHNLSDKDQTTSLNVHDMDMNPSSVTYRYLGRDNESFLPYIYQEKASSLPSSINLKPQESLAIFIDYDNDIEENQELTQFDSFAKNQAVAFTGEKEFDVYIPSGELNKMKDAQLRVGISRPLGCSNDIEISINGKELNVPIEDCIDRYTTSDNSNESNNGFNTTKIMSVPLSYIESNNKIKVKFVDGKSGGVGAVVIRGDYDLTTTGIEKTKIEANNIFFSNKTKELFFKNRESETLNIFNMLGSVVLKKNIKDNENKISLSFLNKGIYFVNFEDGVNQKIIVE